MKYIDHNLGIESDYLKNIDSSKMNNSQYRIKNLYEYNG